MINHSKIKLNAFLFSIYCSSFAVKFHLVKSLRREVDNAGGDGGDLEDLDDGDVGHGVDRVKQDQVERVDDGGTGEGDLASNND